MSPDFAPKNVPRPHSTRKPFPPCPSTPVPANPQSPAGHTPALESQIYASRLQRPDRGCLRLGIQQVLNQFRPNAGHSASTPKAMYQSRAGAEAGRPRTRATQKGRCEPGEGGLNPAGAGQRLKDRGFPQLPQNGDRLAARRREHGAWSTEC